MFVGKNIEVKNDQLLNAHVALRGKRFLFLTHDLVFEFVSFIRCEQQTKMWK